jgi:hypothetical protein
MGSDLGVGRQLPDLASPSSRGEWQSLGKELVGLIKVDIFLDGVVASLSA